MRLQRALSKSTGHMKCEDSCVHFCVECLRSGVLDFGAVLLRSNKLSYRVGLISSSDPNQRSSKKEEEKGYVLVVCGYKCHSCFSF